MTTEVDNRRRSSPSGVAVFIAIILSSSFCLTPFLLFVSGQTPSKTPPDMSYFSDPFMIQFINVTNSHTLLNSSVWLSQRDASSRLDWTQVSYGITCNSSSLLVNDWEFDLFNGVCLSDKRQGDDNNNATNSLFPWLADATYESTETLRQFSGRVITCDWFSYNSSYSGTQFRMCAIGNTSVRYEEFISVWDVVIWDFSDAYSVEPFNSTAVFDIPPQCLSNYTCPQGPIQAMELYNFHAANDFGLNNTDVADLPGDVFFLCYYLANGHNTYYQWISQWQIEVNTTWGKYSSCMDGFCVPGDTRLVGREAPLQLGLIGGQCADNGWVGSWYSLPLESMCRPEDSVGGECSWKVLERTKTINASCLLDRGIASACLDFSTYLSEAQKIFEMAYLSDDPSQGGCPPIDPVVLIPHR